MIISEMVQFAKYFCVILICKSLDIETVVAHLKQDLYSIFNWSVVNAFAHYQRGSESLQHVNALPSPQTIKVITIEHPNIIMEKYFLND